MLEFDEPKLVMELSALPSAALVTFATACAGRLATSLDATWPDHGLISSALNMLSASAAGRSIDAGSLEQKLLAAIPDEDSEPGLTAALAEDTLAALSYALSCSNSGEAQDAAWAACRAYEMVDRYAGQTLAGSSFTVEMEAAIMRHPTVQTELARQRRDLQELRDAQDDPARLLVILNRSKIEPVID